MLKRYYEYEWHFKIIVFYIVRHPSVFARRWTSAESCCLSSGFGCGLPHFLFSRFFASWLNHPLSWYFTPSCMVEHQTTRFSAMASQLSAGMPSAHIFETKFRVSDWAFRFGNLAIEEVLWNTTVVHATNMAEPA